MGTALCASHRGMPKCVCAAQKCTKKTVTTSSPAISAHTPHLHPNTHPLCAYSHLQEVSSLSACGWGSCAGRGCGSQEKAASSRCSLKHASICGIKACMHDSTRGQHACVIVPVLLSPFCPRHGVCCLSFTSCVAAPMPNIWAIHRLQVGCVDGHQQC